MEKKTLSFGCKEDWKIKKLGAISHSFSGGTPSVCVKNYYGGNIPFIKSGEIHRSETEQFLTEEGLCNSAAKLVDKGTILYALYGATSGEVDIAKLSGAINQAILAIIPNRNVDKYFLKEQLLYKKQYIVNTFLQGGQGNLSSAIVNNINISLPSFPEQQSIATFFRTLDNKIQTTSKKLASLKKLKSASLVAMFPQNGESKPKVRFNGFEGEWSKVELCSISKKVTNRNMDMQYTTTLTNSAEHGIIDQLAFFDHQVSNNDNISGYYVVENGDFVYNPRISALAPVGPINQNQIGYTGVMSPLYYVFRVDGVDTDYLSYYFKTTLWHQYLKDVGNSGARFDRLAITDSDFQKMPIYLPTNREEQQAIATFFRSLDRKIALETARLEKLKQIKLACLDKMFV